MRDNISISVIIPTCNRRKSLLRLLKSLTESEYPILEVIIIDAGDELLSDEELSAFSNLVILYFQSERSVCIQRNLGIQKAKGEWVFLCDDDLEVPSTYLTLLVSHIQQIDTTGAISGLVLQMEDKQWKEQYPITSPAKLIWNFVFQLSIWGEIRCKGNNIVIKRIKQYYEAKGNHLSKAGWPVLTNFQGDYFKTPVYGLGASLVRKDWLIKSPYDEVLDANGIGDNFGVAAGFPDEGIHVLNNAFVYHHRELSNRPLNATRYLKRVLALDYFVRSKPQLKHISSGWVLWSLFGSVLGSLLSGNWKMTHAAFKSMLTVLLKRNPYYWGAKSNKKIVEPVL